MTFLASSPDVIKTYRSYFEASDLVETNTFSATSMADYHLEGIVHDHVASAKLAREADETMSADPSRKCFVAGAIDQQIELHHFPRRK